MENSSHANPKAIVHFQNVRFTVLTSRIFRIEYSSSGSFENRSTQVILNRELPVPTFDLKETDEKIEIITQFLHLIYHKSSNGFTPANLSVHLLKIDHIWHFADKDPSNLKGTTRTLDMVDGAISLEKGLISRSGWAVLDDSNTLVFNSQGWLENRTDSEVDLYFFGFGTAYQECIDEYCSLAGKVPMIPRWILGNWWSRYWEYTQDDLVHLMESFESHDIPLSVCIVDMDWHIVNIQNYLAKHSADDWKGVQFHNGWTGFTWNEDFFPDYPSFLQFLKTKQIRAALNLHPASGIAPHESQYIQIAKAMGLDPALKNTVPFDIANPKLAQEYFNQILHPYEEKGVDFWWMDWQQEKSTSIIGLDPLWWLNHLHFLDLGRDMSKRPVIFSRWGGYGNHRYPIGFSGDTYVTWKSLAFQPYFTSTASNVGYSWWSHDLGGHMSGYDDPELYIRWIQFGLFSPVFRLHSTKNPYIEKLPWKFDAHIYQLAKSAMQFRHALIPYIYSMAWKNHTLSESLIRPLYYLHPETDEAYKTQNEYYFGSELLCAPVVDPIDSDLQLNRQVVWLPKGKWFNFFTSEFYKGNESYAIYSRLSEIPVFAKAGAIIPLAHKNSWNHICNPEELDIYIFPGKSNSFELYEDDGVSQYYHEGVYDITQFKLTWKKKFMEFSISSSEEPHDFIPTNRKMNLYIRGIKDIPDLDILENDTPSQIQRSYDENTDTLILHSISFPAVSNWVLKISSPSRNLISRRDRTLSKTKDLIKLMKIPLDFKHFLDQNLQKITSQMQQLTKFLRTMLNSVKYARDDEIYDNDLALLKHFLPQILLGNINTIISPYILDPSQFIESLSVSDTNAESDVRDLFWNQIHNSELIQNVQNLTPNQLRALGEFCGNQIID